MSSTVQVLLVAALWGIWAALIIIARALNRIGTEMRSQRPPYKN